MTGEVFHEAHPVYVPDNIAKKLGNPNSGDFSEAVYNGTQDFTTSGGIVYAGDVPLDVPMPAVPVEPKTVSEPIVHMAHADTTWDMPMTDPIDEHEDDMMQQMLAQEADQQQDILNLI